MLSVNVAAYDSVSSSAFDAALAQSVDFMSVAAYDYHGSWERRTAHSASTTDAVSYNSQVNS